MDDGLECDLHDHCKIENVVFLCGSLFPEFVFWMLCLAIECCMRLQFRKLCQSFDSTFDKLFVRMIAYHDGNFVMSGRSNPTRLHTCVVVKAVVFQFKCYRGERHLGYQTSKKQYLLD